eukprot:14761668-Ditylum_brightwellii.AAC.1
MGKSHCCTRKGQDGEMVMGDTAGQEEETGHIYYSIQSVREYTCNCGSVNILDATVETIKKARSVKT